MDIADYLKKYPNSTFSNSEVRAIVAELANLRERLEKAEKDAELWQFLLREWFREDDQNSWCMSSDAMFAETPEALEKTAREWIKEQKEGKS